MSATLAEAAGSFAASTRFEQLSDKACDTVRLGFTDALAVLLAGRNEEVTRKIVTYAESQGRSDEAVFLLGGGHGSAEMAALVDATACHAIDYDDFAFSNHPSAVLVPTILAASRLTDVDGKGMMAAYAVGYEIWAELMLREKDHLHSKGWHPTAVFGPVAAAAAAASVMKLDADRAVHAIALAASHAGGLMANFGSMTKAYHAGKAAEAGIRAARLASAGFTARSEVLDAETGLLAALTPHGKCDRQSEPRFGTLWRTETYGLNVKLHPTVGASQRCIEAVLTLLRDCPIDSADVVAIRPRISTKFAAVMPFSQPADPAEAKFSLQFACSAALRFGNVGLAELTQTALADTELRRLMGVTEVIAVEEFDPNYPNATPYDLVHIELRDGTVLESPKIKRATGHADAPISTQRLHEKFLDCARWGSVSEDIAIRLFDRAQTLELADGANAFVLL